MIVRSKPNRPLTEWVRSGPVVHHPFPGTYRALSPAHRASESVPVESRPQRTTNLSIMPAPEKFNICFSGHLLTLSTTGRVKAIYHFYSVFVRAFCQRAFKNPNNLDIRGRSDVTQGV